jgi:asparagine synthase (glutamine-hydrolysing)
MCGIAGYFGPREISDEVVEHCLSAMYHRGPDASGSYRYRTMNGRNALVLNRRLAILDLDPRASQPFRHETSVISLNGEIYNYLELRDELAKQGVTFTTTGDTEVLVKLIHREGWRALDRAEGMWGFALFDEAKEKLLLSRDRFGEKPVYLMRDADGGLYFGSEVKFIAILAGRWPKIDQDHLYRYMINGYKALYKNTHGFFEGVTSLDSGSVLTVTADDQQTLDHYWRPGGLAIDNSLSYDDSVALVREALINSVKLRLRADVPLAFCLSGGVDSNALIAIAKQLLDYDVHGFTIINEDERYDERKMVDIAVREMGLRHTAVPINHAEFIHNLRGLIREHDAPVYTITYYVQWQLMKEIAAHGYKVSISGTGADELFSGYYDHHNFYLAEMKGDASRHAEALANWHTHVAPIVRNPFLQDPDVFVKRPRERDHIYLNAQEFTEYLYHPCSEPFSESRYADSHLRNRMLNELFHESVPPILHEDDLNAMYYSIENRSPYLDRTLFETTMRIPTKHLIRRGRAKALLRDAVKGIAPEAILDNPRKVGFNAPILDLLDVNDRNVRASLLDDSPVFDHVRKDRIEALIQRSSLPNSESKFLFYFLNAKLFMEEFAS